MKRFQLLFTKILPYTACFFAALALMIAGSRTDTGSVKEPIAASFDSSNFKVTADQVSELFTVTNIANSVSLPSTPTINENYVTVDTLYTTTGTVNSSTASVIEKPSIIDTSSLARGIISHVVQEGDTVEALASQYGLSRDQLRWSNGLKNETLTIGNTIYIPSVAGIIYTVRPGDTVESLAKKYGSNSDEIISFNDLETSSELEGGSKIILPGGQLPEKERPEYVRPSSSGSYSHSSSYVVDSGVRHGMTQIGSYSYWRSMYYATASWGNKNSFGNCTWFAWYWRRANMPENYWLPSRPLGNASSWLSTLGGEFYTGRAGSTPAYGAIMQSTSGGYGHVAVVVGVSEGSHITIQEMNYAGPNGKFNIVYQSTIYWSDALRYNYIYGRR